ncbi:MAG: carboxypeptidase regulatory-like domain-containing protein [Candidatus Sumerlaeota bacterium]
MPLLKRGGVDLRFLAIAVVMLLLLAVVGFLLRNDSASARASHGRERNAVSSRLDIEVGSSSSRTIKASAGGVEKSDAITASLQKEEIAKAASTASTGAEADTTADAAQEAANSPDTPTPTAAPTPEGLVQIHGRTVDQATGQGIARIEIGTQSRSERARPKDSIGRGNIYSPFTISDKDGKFSLSIPSQTNIVLYSNAPGKWVSMGMSELFPDTNTITLTPNQIKSGEEIVWKFVIGYAIKGKVLEENGNASSSAFISAIFPGIEQRNTAVEEGAFTLYVPMQGRWEVTAQGDLGFGREAAIVPEVGELPEILIHLKAYATVSGTVKDTDGRPVVGLNMDAANGSSTTQWGWPHSSRTNENGYYFFDKLMDGPVSVSVRSESNKTFTQPAPISFELGAGEHKEDVNFVVGEGLFIEGSITNERKAPVESASVKFQGMRGDLKTATSDDKGYYRVAGLREDESFNYVTASHPLYTNVTRNNVTVLDGRQDFVLKDAREVMIIAIDSQTEEPIQHYDYAIAGGAGQITSVRQHVDSAEGKTTTKEFMEGTNSISVYETDDTGKKTRREGTRRIDLNELEGNEVVVKIGGGSKITGIVLEEGTRTPVSGVTVTANESMNGLTEPGDPFAQTDTSGHFEIVNIYTRIGSLFAQKGDLTARVQRPDNISFDGDWENAEILLGGLASIHGHVIGQDGGPLIGGTVGINGYSPRDARIANTDTDGNYRLTGLPSGKTSFYAGEGDDVREYQFLTLKPSEDMEVNFDLSQFVIVTGKISMNGEPIPEENLQFTFAALDGSHRSTFGGSSAYKFCLKAGTYIVTYQLGSMKINVETVDIPPQPKAQQHDVNLIVCSADAVVDMANGEEFSGGYLEIRTITDKFNNSMGSSMSTNRKHIPRIPLGTYIAKFRNSKGEAAAQSEPTTITSGGENVFYIPIAAKKVEPGTVPSP